MNIRPAFKVCFRELLGSSAAYLAIFALVMLLLALSVSGTGVFGGYEISGSIFLFVSGIVAIRENLRLGLQNGVGRKTVFLATLLSSVLAALCLASVGELAIAAIQALPARGEVMTTSLYSVLFHGVEAYPAGEAARPAAVLGAHLAAVLFTFSVMLCANVCGSFISLVFYRLNKRWTVVVAAGTPILLFWVLPLLLSRSGIDFGALLEKIRFTGANVTVFFLGWAAVAAGLNFLLLRRAPVLPAGK